MSQEEKKEVIEATLVETTTQPATESGSPLVADAPVAANIDPAKPVKLRHRGLTMKERYFAQELVKTTSQSKAAKKVYKTADHKDARDKGALVANRPIVARYVEELIERKYPSLKSDALNVLQEIMNRGDSDKTRLEAVKIVIGILGWEAPKQSESKTLRKTITSLLPNK